MLALRNGPEDEGTAISVDSAGAVPTVTAVPEPPPVTAAMSLADLAREARAKASTTSTTRARATSTTAKPRPTTTSTPRPAATTTTTRPAGPPAIAPPTVTTTPLTPLTTLLEKVVPPAAAVSSALTKSDSGVASWFKAPAATCAHRTLPMGTLVKVVRVSSGASATCKVDDRGPILETGRLIDLSLDTFEKLADRDTGLIDVTIHW